MAITRGEGSKKNNPEWVRVPKEVSGNSRDSYVKIASGSPSGERGIDRDFSDEISSYYDTQIPDRTHLTADLVDKVSDFVSIDPPMRPKRPFGEIEDHSVAFITDKRQMLDVLKQKHDAGGLFDLYRDVALSYEYADMISAGFDREVKGTKEYKDLFMSYRTLLAEAVDHSYKFSGGTDLAVDYHKDSLGSMHKVGDFEPGTREWLEFRQGGMGASDVNAIIHTSSKYAPKNIMNVFNSKVTPITDKDVARQGTVVRDYTNPMHRGTALEDFVADAAMLSSPSSYEYYHDKGTWSGGHSDIIRVNYDYMFDSRKGAGKDIDGTLEIKTSGSFMGWGKDLNDPASISKSYFPQLIVQARMADMDYASVGVMVNERDLRVYNIEIDDSIRSQADEYIHKAESFYQECQEYKKTGKKPELVEWAEKKIQK